MDIGQGTYVVGANIAGFCKVADAMLNEGAYSRHAGLVAAGYRESPTGRGV